MFDSVDDELIEFCSELIESLPVELSILEHSIITESSKPPYFCKCPRPINEPEKYFSFKNRQEFRRHMQTYHDFPVPEKFTAMKRKTSDQVEIVDYTREKKFKR